MGGKSCLLIALFPMALMYAGALSPFTLSTPSPLNRPIGIELRSDGTLLVTDGGGFLWNDKNSKVLQLDYSGKILWSYSNDLRFAHSACTLRNGNVLIPDTNNNRLIEINKQGQTVWSSETWTDLTLDYPNHVTELSNGRLLVSDRNNSRVIEVDKHGTVYWSYQGKARQHGPERLANGNTIICESEENRIIEINQEAHIIWQYSKDLNWPRDADRLPNGNTLITDSKNHRIIEIDPRGELIWEYSKDLKVPYEADRLPNGNTLICDSQHARLIEVDPDGKLVWEFRNIATSYPSSLGDGSFSSILSLLGRSPWIPSTLTAHNRGRWFFDYKVKKIGLRSACIEDYSQEYLQAKWWAQRVSVSPGSRIKVSTYVKCEEVVGQAALFLLFLDEYGGPLEVLQSKGVNGTTDWTRHQIEVPINEETHAVEVRLQLLGIGKAWFDDISFESHQTEKGE